jgi:hypothetical protein
VERVFDFLDCSLLRKALEVYDARFKTRIWDVSQNIYMNEDGGAFGITGCITPSGQFFASDAGRVLSAEENLILQGIPLSKISFTTETSKELQDLAGNAMTSTVVASAMLSALIAGHKLITQFFDFNEQSLLPTTPKAKIAPAPARSIPISPGCETIDVPSLLDVGSRAIRRCFCEGGGRTCKSARTVDTSRVLRAEVVQSITIVTIRLFPKEESSPKRPKRVSDRDFRYR